MNQKFFVDLVEGALQGMSRFDGSSSDSQTLKIVAAVAVGVGVTAVAGVAVAAAVGGFVLLQDNSLLPWSRPRRPKPLTREKWSRAFEHGSLKANGRKILTLIRRGGCEPDIRYQVWPFLLGLYSLQSSELERKVERKNQRKNYEELLKMSKILEGANIKLRESAPTPTESSANGSELSSEIDDGFTSDGSTERKQESCPTTNCETANLKKNDSTLALPEDSTTESVSLGEVLTNGETSEPGSSEGDEELPLLSSKNPDVSREHTENNSEFGKRLAKVEGVLRRKEDLENFATWQRIMRLDAVRMNAAWVPYSSQAEVNPILADEMAKSVRLGEYSHLDSSRRLHAARLVSILEAYAVYDFEIGYCQGMSDLLSPFVALIDDDSDAFWCYQRFMSKARQNYRLDEMGIRNQLNSISKILELGDPELFAHLEEIGAGDCIFVYRMVVVLLRRELSFEQTITLWEILWADALACEIDRSLEPKVKEGETVKSQKSSNFRPCENLLLYVIAAIVKRNRLSIIRRCSGLDEVMRLCNSLAGNLNIWELLEEARALFRIVESI